MSVLDIMYAVADMVRVRYLVESARIDNLAFRAHYRVTSLLIFTFSILLTASHLVGNPIDCINDIGIPVHVTNSYCWLANTFTLPDEQKENSPDIHSDPGLGNENEIQEKRYHSYYQWVPFALLVQGILFYLPHWIWKNCEGYKMTLISEGLRGAIMESTENRKQKQSRLVQYLVESLHTHNFYACSYFVCEVLNLINVFINIIATDYFLGGAFLEYGFKVILFSYMNQEARTDPMVKIFPRVTKCIFHKYGRSGTIQKYDALCILALNIVNEKVYIFLWFWFIILAVLSAVAFVYSLAIALCLSIRKSVLKKHYRFANRDGAETIIKKTKIGDFFLLHLLGQNIELAVFEEILNDFVTRLNFGSDKNPQLAPSTSTTSLSYVIETENTQT